MVRLMDTTRPRCVDENGISRVYVYAYIPLTVHACALSSTRECSCVRFHILPNAMIASLRRALHRVCVINIYRIIFTIECGYYISVLSVYRIGLQK